jgi:hypothetical protein
MGGGRSTMARQRRKVTLPPGYSQLVRCLLYLCMCRSPSLLQYKPVNGLTNVIDAACSTGCA